MDQFIKLLPDEKSVTCLDDRLSLKVSELKKNFVFIQVEVGRAQVCSGCLEILITTF